MAIVVGERGELEDIILLRASIKTGFSVSCLN
jgi:hypothetical protein